MIVNVLWQLVFAALLVSAAAPTRTLQKRDNNSVPSSPSPEFVTTQNGQFFLDGKPFRFVGTNAYWLHALNTDEDIDNTLASISAAGIKVIRTWAFNDVEEIPETGTWFQMINNGTLTINTGPNGLQKLDKVVELAEKHGIYVLLSLTNNWNPSSLDSAPLQRRNNDGNTGAASSKKRARNFLSNDYGGMDAYVRQFGSSGHHDQFYVEDKIVEAFKSYTTHIVSRYVNSPAVFGWELANDPRCNSTLPATDECQPKTITEWHAKLSEHIKSIDPNHMVSSGNQGFFCVDCPKLFPRNPTPPPQVSPAPGSKSRRAYEALTKPKLLRDRKAAWKRAREVKIQAGERPEGVKVRGRWVASPTRRQSDFLAVGPSFDGSQGVDSEDISNIPDIDFGSFQLLPDQVQYAADTSIQQDVIQQGVDWINLHAELGRALGKPMMLTSFGLVTQGNAPEFVPSNSTVAPFGVDQGPMARRQDVGQTSYGVTEQGRDNAYSAWINAGVVGGLQAMFQYQWGQANLASSPGSPIGVSGNQNTAGISPNDGYSILGIGQESALQVIAAGNQAMMQAPF